MGDIDRMVTLSAYVHGSSSAVVLPQLCGFLVKRGLLSSAEIESLRHSALQSYDELRERKDLEKDELERLEKARGHLESMWQRVSLEAEAQDKDRG